ncbi:MAG: mobA-like transferase domain protein [Sporomusa sp.]|jgi:NDP-sugar pyrophosphorylase family protein|nr:mobA-like transferase domain protein [Sporomusa sp.]
MSNKCAVILAGGKGTRLRPYTIAMPKPLVPVGDAPIMEIVIRQLRKNGFDRIILTVNHQAELIKAYFGDGSKWGLKIEYSLEDKPLGTMGPLRLIKGLPDSFLVMNGDILTDLNYGDFLEKHIKSDSIYTISGYKRTHKVDYGVLHINEDSKLCGFEEKPELYYSVSMGVYAVSKEILEYIPYNEYFGFDNLMHKLINSGKSVTVDVFDGYWLDIGRPEDYAKATEDFEEKKGCFL